MHIEYDNVIGLCIRRRGYFIKFKTLILHIADLRTITWEVLHFLAAILSAGKKTYFQLKIMWIFKLTLSLHLPVYIRSDLLHNWYGALLYLVRIGHVENIHFEGQRLWELNESLVLFWAISNNYALWKRNARVWWVGKCVWWEVD